MKKFIFVTICCLLTSLVISGQNTVIDYQETVHLELPETRIVNDYIFFKAYVHSNAEVTDQVASGVLHLLLKDNTERIITKQYHAIVNGVVNGGIHLPKKRTAGEYTIEAYTQWMQNYDNSTVGSAQVCIDCKDLSDTRKKPLNALKITIEGGLIVSDIPSKIIIKSPTETDMAAPTLGTIVDTQGDYVSTVHHFGSGYGAAVLTPKRDITYYYKTLDGTQLPLPEVSEQGFVMTANNLDKEVLQLRITASTGVASNSPRLVGYHKGVMLFEKPLNFRNKDVLDIKLPKKELPKGLIKLYLLDSSNTVMSYRPVSLVEATTSITAQVLSQNKESTQLKIKVCTNQKGAPNLPITVAGFKDTKEVLPATTPEVFTKKQEYIKTLSLQTTYTPERLEHLKVPLKNNKNYPIQEGLHLIGTAYDLNNELLRNERIEVFASSNDGVLIEEVLTTDEGILTLSNMKLLGSNQIIFRKKADDLKSRLVKIKPLEQPEATTKKTIIAATTIAAIKTQEKKEREAIPFDIKNTDRLSEVEVDGTDTTHKKNSPSTYGIEPPSSRSKLQNPDKPKTIPQLLQSIPGVIVSFAEDPLYAAISIPSGTGSILFVIDGFPLLQDGGSSALSVNKQTSLNPLINMVNATDVERIELLMGADAAIYGSRAAGGVIEVYTRNGSENKFTNRKEASLLFQGFEPEISFDTYWADLSRNERKNNNLVYWNSNIQLDAQGETIITIPHKNKELPKRITIATVSKDGTHSSLSTTIVK